jgi:hypothetical protein
LLTSFDGASVDLRITDYQFPERDAPGRRDWDANWLNICGFVTQADGRSWTFVDPSLTTWEARALAEWLQVRGQQPDIFDYFVRVDPSAKHLAGAAESWMHELAEYPER